MAQTPSLDLTMQYEGEQKNGRLYFSVSGLWEDENYLFRIYKLSLGKAVAESEEITHPAGSTSTDIFDFQYSFQKAETKKITIDRDGIYSFVAKGGAGENNQKKQGGKGSELSGFLYLKKNQKLTISTKGGGSGTNHGGNALSMSILPQKNQISETVLIAGGGGGASIEKNGGNGGGFGTENRLPAVVNGNGQFTICNGQNGIESGAGGGGGYNGGTGGSLQLHHHVIPAGAECIEGGYTKSNTCYSEEKDIETVVECGTYVKKPYTWYCDTCFDTYGPNSPGNPYTFWVGKQHQEETGHETKSSYHAECDGCGGVENESMAGAWHVKKSTRKIYLLSCTKTYDSNTAAAGGSDYAISKKAGKYTKQNGYQFCYSSQKSGSNTGVAYIRLKYVSADYGDLASGNVLALDKASPEPVSSESGKVRLADANDRTVAGYLSGAAYQMVYSWNGVRDYGSVYAIRVEGYSPQAILDGKTAPADGKNSGENGFWGNKAVFALQQRIEATSGILGYRYWQSNAKEDKQTSTKPVTSDTKVCVSLAENAGRYLHIQTLDYAGNESEIVNIDLQALPILWPIETECLQIEETDGIYQNGDIVFVRGDGKSSYYIKNEAVIRGMARSLYQINYSVLVNQIGKTQQVISCENSLDGLEHVTLLEKGTDAFFQTCDVFSVSRSDQNKRLRVVTKWTPTSAMDKLQVHVVPRAIALEKSSVPITRVYSDEIMDNSHGLYLVVDGKAPTIEGVDALLSHSRLIDRGIENYKVKLQAYDDGSGLLPNGFTVNIYNQDSGVERIITGNASGELTLELTENGDKDAFLNGRLLICIRAVDRVGNVCTLTNQKVELNLTTKVERYLRSIDGRDTFKRGESGLLTITGWGFMDRLEVIFPSKITNSNSESNLFYYYTRPSWKMEEQIDFMIPLDLEEAADGKPLEIIIRGYRGNESIEIKPRIEVIYVEGTVLDDIRTILR